MGNNSYIIDPLTGNKIYNDSTKKTTSSGLAINPLTGVEMESGFEAAPLFGKGSINPTPQGTVRDDLNLSEVINTPLSPNRSLEESQDIRANLQGNGEAFVNSMAKAGVTFLGATADNTIGGFVGLGSMAIQGKASGFYNNFWGQSLDQVNEYMQENFPVYQTREQDNEGLLGSLNNAAFWDKAFNGAAYSMASAASLLLPASGLSKLSSIARKGAVKQAAHKLTKDAANVLTKEALSQGRQIDQGISFLTRSMKSAIAESGVEARGTKSELKDKLLQDLIAKKGGDIESITQEEFNKIEDLSDYAANANFATNLAVVGGSNFITFGSIVRGNSDDMFKAIKAQIKEVGGKWVKREGKLEAAKQMGKGLVVDGGTEAFQEGFQFASNIAYQDYYSNKNKNGETANLAKSFSKGMHETLNTKDGLESMLIGAIVGGGMSGFKGARDVVKNLKGKVDPAVEEALSIINSDSFIALASKVKDENTVNAFRDDMIQFAGEGDQKGFIKSFHNMLMADVRNHAKQGTEGILLEKLQEVSEFSSEKFNKYFGMKGVTLDPKTTIEAIIESTKKGVEISKNIDYLFEPKKAAIEKLAKTASLNSTEVEDYLKDQVFRSLSSFEYINNEEARLSKELEQETDGQITYDKNMGISNKYITETDKQFEEFIKSDKFINDNFLNAFFNNPSILSDVDDMLARSKKAGTGKFKTRKDVLKQFFFPDSKLTKKQAELMTALESLKQNNQLRPDKKERVAAKIKDLQGLAVEREIANVAFRDLLNLEQNENELSALVKDKINGEKQKLKDALKEETANADTKEKKDTVQAKAATMDAADKALDEFANIDIEEPKLSREIEEQLGEMADQVYQQINNDKYDFNDSFVKSLVDYVNDNPEALNTVVEDFNAIIKKHDELGLIDVVDNQEQQAQLLAEKLEQVNDDSATQKNLKSHINDLKKINNTEPIIDGQNGPVEVRPQSNQSELDKINEAEQQELNNLGQKQIQKSLDILQNLKTVNVKSIAAISTEILRLEMNVESGAILTSEQQKILDAKKQEVANAGYEFINYTNTEFNEGLNYTTNQKIADSFTVLTPSQMEEAKRQKSKGNKDIEIVIKSTKPQLNKDGKMVQSANVDVLVILEQDVDAVLKNKPTDDNIVTFKKNKIKAKYQAQRDALTSKPIVETLESQKKPTKSNFDDNQSLIITLTGKETIAARKAKPNSTIPAQDKFIGTLHDLEFGQRGTEVLFEYPDNEYNRTNPAKPQIMVYAIHNGQRIDMGIIGSGATIDSLLTKEIYKEIKDNPIGTADIDLGIIVDEKWGGKMNNQEESYNPIERNENPKLGTVLRDKSGNIELFTNGLNIDYRVTDNIKNFLGHTFEFVPSAAKNISGETIYYPSHLVTKTLENTKDGTVKANKIYELVINSQIIDDNGKKSVDNKIEVNKSIFLDYFVEGDFVNVSSPSLTNPDKKIVTRYNKTSPEDQEKLRTFINNALVKIDYLKINTGNYNKSVLENENVISNLDKVNPLYDTRFVLARKDKSIDSYDLSEGDILEGAEFNDDVDNDSYEDLDDNFIANLFENEDTESVISLDDANIINDEDVPKARISTTEYERGDNEEEVAWLKKRFPNTPVSVIEDLNRVAAQGKNAWGLFLNGSIYLQKNFSKGTAYHEAFHAVFNSYMSPEEQNTLYAAAQAEYGTHSLEQEKELKKLYPNLNNEAIENIWLEEQMAEDYRRHVQKLKNRTTSQKLVAFFNKLYKILTFTNNEKYIDSVFKNIDNGKYGKRPMNFRFTNVPMYSQKLGALNFYESRESTELIDRTFQKVLDVLSKKHNTRDEVKLLNIVGVNKVYSQVFQAINKKRKEVGLSGPKKKFLGETLRHFKTTDNKIGSTILNHKRYYKYRYKINLDKNEELENSIIETAQETEEKPNWITPTVEKNGKDTLSIKLKRVLYRLHSDETDVMGYKKYVDYDSLYNTLERKLSGVFDIDSFENRLNEIAVLFPSIRELNTKFKKDLKLFSQFYHHFSRGQNQYMMPAIKVETDETTGEEMITHQVANLSRVNVKNEVLKNVESFIQNSKLVRKDGSVNVQSSKPLYTKFSNELTRLSNMQNKTKINDESFEELSSILNSYGVKLTPEDLKKELTLLKPNAFIKMFQNDSDGIKKIFKALSDGSNPFTDGKASTIKSLQTLTNLVADSAFDYYQSALTTTDGKTIHSYVTPNLIHRYTAELNGKEALNKINYLQSDPSYRHSFLLEKAKENIDKEDQLDVVVLDGLNNETERTNNRYSSFNAKDYSISKLLMYWNNGNKDSYYAFPELADAPVSYYMRTNKLSDKEDLIDKLYNLFLFEHNRIATDTEVENYDNTKLNTYVMFPFLNDKKFIKEYEAANEKSFSINKPSSVKDTIKYYYDTVSYPEFKESLIKSGTIAIDSEGKLISPYLPTNLKDTQFTGLDDFLQKANMASSVMLGEIQVVYLGDPLFAKPDNNGNRTTDINKRSKEINAPMKPLDTRTMGETSFTGIILGTTEVSTKDTDFVKAAIAVNKKLGNKLTGTIDRTDGQSFTSIQRFRAIAINNDTWSEEAEELYPKLLAGTESPTETGVFFNSIKGFYAGLSRDGNGKIVPLQKKDSELPISPSMAKNNPVVKMILDRLNSEGDFDGYPAISQISFESTIKKGLRHVIPTNKGMKKALLESNKLEQIIEYSYDNYGIQQPSPAHHLDDRVNFMTQFRKLFISNLSGTYKFDDTLSIEANDLKSLVNDIVVKNLEEDYKKLERQILNADKSINFKELRKLLIEELENMNYSPDFIEALDITENGFRLKPWNPKHSSRIESMMNAFIKNKISRQKTNGGQFVNATDLIVEDSSLLLNGQNLEFKIGYTTNEEGVEIPYLEHVEAIMPAWSKALMQQYMNEDGTLSDDMPDSLKELVGVRIPTEAKYSMLKIKVVGFTPAAAGSQIYLPVQAIKQTGMDFDIDKMFMILPNYKTFYGKDATDNGYNFIRNQGLSTQTIIDELVKFDENDDVFLTALKYAKLTPNKLNDLFIEKVLLNSEFDNAYKDIFLNRYDNSIQGIEYIKPDLTNVDNLKSKEQRDNALLEIAKTILSSPQTFEEQIKFNNFDNLIRLKKNLSKINGLSSNVENPILANTQLELFLKNADAAKSIGVAANNNSSHAALQYENITLDTNFETLGFKIGKLDPKDPNIAESLGELIAASVDAIKDPVFYELNINGFTINILTSMLRMGVPLDNAVTFLSTPVIIDLSQNAALSNINGFKQTHRLIAEKQREIAKKFTKGKTISVTDYATEKDVKVGKQLSAEEEFKLLNTFYRFASISNDLKTITAVSKLESNPPGSLMSNNEMVFRDVHKVKTNDFKNFSNVSTMLDTNSNYKMIQGFYKYTYELPTRNIFNKMFPWLRPSFIQIKNVLEANYTKDLDPSLINHINYNLLTYLIADNENTENALNISDEELTYLNVQFPFDVINAKEKYPNNKLIQQLKVDNENSTIEFNNLGAKSVEKTMELEENWQDLINDPETRKLGEDLFKFNFISHGFIFSKASFYDLAPVKLFEQMINQESIETLIEQGNFSLFMDQYLANTKNAEKVFLKSITSADVTEDETGKLYLGEDVKMSNSKNNQREFPLYVKYNNGILKLANIADAKKLNMPEARYVKIPTLGNANRLEYSFKDPISESKYTLIDKTIKENLPLTVAAQLNNFADSYSEQALNQMPDSYFSEFTEGSFEGMEEQDLSDSVLDQLGEYANVATTEISSEEQALLEESLLTSQEDVNIDLDAQIEAYRNTGDLNVSQLNELNKIDKIEDINEKTNKLSEFIFNYCN